MLTLKLMETNSLKQLCHIVFSPVVRSKSMTKIVYKLFYYCIISAIRSEFKGQDCPMRVSFMVGNLYPKIYVDYCRGLIVKENGQL